jgi:nicotinamidase-related amidase
MSGPDVRHTSVQVILFIDVINHFEFPDGDKLLRQALRIAPNLVRLSQRAHKAKVPIVYVNDNFGQWRSERSKLIESCSRPESRGRKFVRQIAPTKEDYFVLKPMHSAFYQTALDVLLRYFEASSLILCGISTNSCVMCTGHDAKMRDFELIVASDCCAAPSVSDHRTALKHLSETAGARVAPSMAIRLSQRNR